ncbi:hypothetical protein CDEST_07245 [Colletotrichum destructivum]|uniref:Uncharacterized protein n=1 Tax=Colletotrichum destructivum TaxID=34406 RepID=A0AAX4IGJ9_9PEZI|nr:hypothetical protein CDEST_07245 [Colletotrichum destructivum]
MPPTDVFPSFHDSPLEMRLKIWREALLVPSVWVAVGDGAANGLDDPDNQIPPPINMGFIGLAAIYPKAWTASPSAGGANGLEQFAVPYGCVSPARCGNGDRGERCERLSGAAARSQHQQQPPQKEQE